MAKWGEGDPRWIVEERPDAANVNNWHWSEKNATPWSRNRLKELLCDAVIVEKGSIVVRTGKEFKKLEGEATANNRKAKLIFLYEWEVEMSFEATVSGSETKYEGQLEIPNLSDENMASEVDVNVTITTKGAHEAEIRHLLSADGQKKIRELVGIYIRELREEFSKGLILPTDKTKPQVMSKNKTTADANKDVDRKAFQSMVVTANGDPSVSACEPVTTTAFEGKETFKVPPSQLYEVITKQELVEKWTNSKASLVLKEGGAFSLYNGMVTGIFDQMCPPDELKMRWRLKSYPANHYAVVTMSFKDQGDATELVVSADNVPVTQADETKDGFERHYFQNIIRTFGFGARLF